MDTQRLEDSGFRYEEDYWPAQLLYEAAAEQGCVPYVLPIQHLDLTDSMENWDGSRIADVAFTARRIMRTNLDYPIILGPLGNIMDGWHRVAKAVALGKPHVMALRLKTLPDPQPVDD